ncbi:MAG: TIGR00730 family Rossman fold protein [Clostridia bacterium]|nr:TIGR00730 family Rossman fold protein [Clostridia bacterium]
MKICLFGAASELIDERYMKRVEALGETLAKRGHTMIFGAGGTGLMGAAARGIKRVGGKVIGVIPEFFREEAVEVIFDDCDEIIYTDSMHERKRVMEDEADAFIITPGGIGTFEEFFEVLTLKQLGRHKKPIAIYNLNGYFDGLFKLLEGAINGRFLNTECRSLYTFSDNVEDIFDYIEQEEHFEYNILELKKSFNKKKS